MSSQGHNWTFYPASKIYHYIPRFLPSSAIIPTFTRFWLIQGIPLHGDVFISSPPQAAQTCSCLSLSRTLEVVTQKLFCSRSRNSGIWKEAQHSAAGGKWHYWELDLGFLRHWGASAKDFKISTSSRTTKWSCESCVCQLEMGIWANTRKLVYHWCSPFKAAGAKHLNLWGQLNCTPEVLTSEDKSLLSSLWDAGIWFCTWILTSKEFL